MSRPYQWPGDATATVSLTFDVDGESSWLSSGPGFEKRLSTLSGARFGIARGLPRILSLLARHDLAATFFVPGETVERHPRAIADLLDAGHEIAHHGHGHLHSDGLSPELQREEIEKGVAAIEAIGAPTPRGYRSPAWEVTPETFELIVAHGFVYDSSFMGDDRAYVESHAGGKILELPVSWRLDDWPLIGWSPYFPNAKLAPSSVLLDTWLGEYRQARTEGRNVTYTMHPDVIGAGSSIGALETLIETIVADGDVWMARLDAVAAHVGPLLGMAGDR